MGRKNVQSPQEFGLAKPIQIVLRPRAFTTDPQQNSYKRKNMQYVRQILCHGDRRKIPGKIMALDINASLGNIQQSAQTLLMSYNLLTI